MAIQTITIVVKNIAEVLAIYDQIKVYRSATGAVGTFAEITGIGTRLTLGLNTTQYTYIDTTGASTDYYASSYFNSVNLTESSLSSPTRGRDGGALNILSVDELKELYLFGVDLTDQNGNPFPDSIFIHNIQAAAARIGHELDLPVLPKIYTEEEPNRIDYVYNDWMRGVRLQVDEFPVLSVESITLRFIDQNVAAITFPTNWIRIDKDQGWINVVPSTPGTLLVLGQPLALPPMSMWGHPGVIPQGFAISYTAGFDPMPPEIKDLVGKAATIPLLGIAADLVYGPGIKGRQLSLDSVMSNTKVETPYKDRIARLREEIKASVKDLRLYYKGILAEVG